MQVDLARWKKYWVPESMLDLRLPFVEVSAIQSMDVGSSLMKQLCHDAVQSQTAELHEWQGAAQIDPWQRQPRLSKLTGRE
jgi:hypothetical protein